MAPHILIVAADPLMRHMVAEGQIEAGFHVIDAAGLGQAHSILKNHQSIELLIVDLDFPDGGGLSLADDARSFLPELPVLFITNRDEDVDESRLDIILRGFSEPFGVMALFDAWELLRAKHSEIDGHHDGVDLKI
jgi:CheY-like chemotaxis protein